MFGRLCIDLADTAKRITILANIYLFIYKLLFKLLFVVFFTLNSYLAIHKVLPTEPLNSAPFMLEENTTASLYLPSLRADSSIAFYIQKVIQTVSTHSSFLLTEFLQEL